MSFAVSRSRVNLDLAKLKTLMGLSFALRRDEITSGSSGRLLSIDEITRGWPGLLIKPLV